MTTTTANPFTETTNTPAQTAIIKDFIAKRLPEYQALALDIHEHPEVSNYEFYSAGALVAQLEKEGFTVAQDVAGHRTGFDARYLGKKPGPTLAFLAEFDALPGIGHACGHNLFGTYSVLAASALKELIDEVGGELRVYGTPGEEGGENGSAKGSMGTLPTWMRPCASIPAIATRKPQLLWPMTPWISNFTVWLPMPPELRKPASAPWRHYCKSLMGSTACV